MKIIGENFLLNDPTITVKRLTEETWGEWSGNGISKTYYPMNGGPIDTNVGTIYLTSRTYYKGKFFYEFQGTGMPKEGEVKP